MQSEVVVTVADVSGGCVTGRGRQQNVVVVCGNVPQGTAAVQPAISFHHRGRQKGDDAGRCALVAQAAAA